MFNASNVISLGRPGLPQVAAVALLPNPMLKAKRFSLLKALFGCALWMAALGGAALQAQTSGTIVGRVTDPAQAIVPNAHVELVNEATGIKSSATTSADGEYIFQRVAPGSYSLSAGASGFQTVVNRGIQVLVNQTARMDLQLQVGSVTSSIEVSARAPIVQSETSSLGNVVDGNQVKSMPLNGRTGIYGLMAMAPGVQGAGSNPAIAGSAFRGGTGETVDGVSNDDAMNERLQDQILSLEAVSEFKVIASGAPAEFGKNAQIVVATKSGGNSLHGSLFAFNRNAFLAAKSHAAQTIAKPAFNRNEYGGSVGGPIKKNKLFYFGSFEGLRLVQPTTTQYSMPTKAMKSGDFSALTNITLKNPAANGARFPNNQIPVSMISPISQTFMKWMPDPNLPGGAFGLGTNYVANASQHQPNDRYSARADYTLTDRDTLTGRYFWTNNGPYATAVANGPVPFNNWDAFGRTTKNLAAQYTRILTSSLVNIARVGLDYHTNFRTPQNHTLDPSTIIPGLTPPFPGLGGLPTINISGFTTLSDQPGSGDVNHVRQVMDSVSWERSKHTFKFGFEFMEADVVNHPNAAPQRGSFSFDGRYAGQSFADFLMGNLSGSSKPTSNGVVDLTNYRYAAYAQDDWRVSTRLTLNLGVRWDYESPWIPNSDFAIWRRDLNKLIMIHGQAAPLFQGAVPYVEGSSLGMTPSNYMNLGKKNFAPRFGFAYRPLGKPTFVIRGSYGIFYNALGSYDDSVGISQFGQNPPFRASVSYFGSNNGVPNLTWNDAWAGTVGAPANPNVFGLDKNFRQGYNQQWNYTMEWEPAHDIGLRVSYVGSKATHFVSQININDPLPSPNPIQPRRPFQPWGTVNYYSSDRNHNFNQLQLGATRRYASGLAFGVEYQFTRSLGRPANGVGATTWTNLRLDYGNSNQYVRHYAVANYIYDLPFGRGKRLLKNAGPILNKVVGGWQVAGISTLASGGFFSVGFNSTLTGWNSGRANIVGNPAGPRTAAQWFNTAAFAVPAQFTYGNSSPFLMQGPGVINWDSALFKTTPITEGVSLEIRCEAFNVLNHANLGNPGTNISVPSSFGIITSRNGSRVMQFGARLAF